jgi:hypothetical protein
MAIYKLFSTKDSFIYTEKQLANLGRDELLEVGGYHTSAGGQTLRTLIKFDTAEIQDIVNNKAGGGTVQTNLHLYLNMANELPIDFNINCYPVSEDWDEGAGKFGDTPVNKSGVSWNYKNAGASNHWVTGSFATYVTASFESDVLGGGTWYTGSASSNLESVQSFNKTSDLDIDMDITNGVMMHYSESLDNNGFIIKLPNSLENNLSASIRLKYYGNDTNTIYPPSLDIKWDDYTHSSTLPEINDPEVVVSIRNNKGKYTDEGKQRFRVHARPKYPTRTFTTSSAYTVNYTLPTASYWGLKDENTEEMVFDYDNTFTKISADNTSNYFDIYMDGIQPERYYRLLIKTEIDGTTTIIDNDQVFKVVRNG